MMDATVIEVTHLTKRFGDVVAVDDLSFTVPPGGITGFLGPNGAGKTTTLRMLLGLVAPTAGEAQLFGAGYGRSADRRRVGAVLEASSSHPGRTVRDQLRVRSSARDIPRRRIDVVLDLVGLADLAGRRAGRLSLGERQRLALAAAMLGDPELLVLDEPANGLDPEGVRWLRGFLRTLAREGRTILFSSHALAEVSQTVDQLVVLDRGRLVAHCSLQDFMADSRPVVRVRTSRPDELRRALEADGAHVEGRGADELEIVGSNLERVASVAAGNQIPVLEISSQAESLEAVFLRRTSGKGVPA
jgi:ABC-2 type transport system ATP-binding protein